MRIFSAFLGLIGLSAAANFTNPLKNPNGSDPFIVYDGGYYYLTTTTWNDVQITRARTLEGLKNGERKVAFQDSNNDRCCQVWAPEIHKIDGTWYIYYTAGRRSGDLGYQRGFVLKGGRSPWDTYTYAGQLTSGWGIDATIANINNRNYYIYSCQSQGMQSLCIAPLTSPTTIGASTAISHPTLPWEREKGELPVNEGPTVLQQNGRTFMAFSASFCWTDKYQLGLLTLTGSDPMRAASWTKSGPVFSSANGNYGTGHNAFFKSPDGTEWWNVYHATTNANGACDGNRYTAAQKVEFGSNGVPNLGRATRVGTSMVGPSGE